MRSLVVTRNSLHIHWKGFKSLYVKFKKIKIKNSGGHIPLLGMHWIHPCKAPLGCTYTQVCKGLGEAYKCGYGTMSGAWHILDVGCVV